MVIAYECRHDAHEKVDKEKRYAQIKSILGEREMTAREVAEEMFDRGYTNNRERNNSAPRLTELVDRCEVEEVGKKKDNLTGKSVTTYRLIAKQISLFA